MAIHNHTQQILVSWICEQFMRITGQGKYTFSHLETFIIVYCDITGHDAVLVITDNHCQEKLPLQNKILNNMKYIPIVYLQTCTHDHVYLSFKY